MGGGTTDDDDLPCKSSPAALVTLVGRCGKLWTTGRRPDWLLVSVALVMVVTGRGWGSTGGGKGSVEAASDEGNLSTDSTP